MSSVPKTPKKKSAASAGGSVSKKRARTKRVEDGDADDESDAEPGPAKRPAIRPVPVPLTNSVAQTPTPAKPVTKTPEASSSGPLAENRNPPSVAKVYGKSRQVAPSTPAAPAAPGPPAKAIPGMKALTDILGEVRADVVSLKGKSDNFTSNLLPGLQKRVEKAMTLAHSLETRLDKLQASHDDVSATLETVEQDLSKLEGNVEYHEEMLAKFQAYINEREQDEKPTLMSKIVKGKKTKAKGTKRMRAKRTGQGAGSDDENIKPRNNAFNGFIRTAFYKMMGLEPQGKDLHAGLARGFWVKKTNEQGEVEELLRPNFKGTWTSNLAWHDKALKIVKTNGIGWTRGVLTLEELEEFNDDEILVQLETVFKGCKLRYARQLKAKEEVQSKEKTNRRESRKARKAMLRREIRSSVPGLQDEIYNWMFLPQYQSTDESQWDDVLSANTDEETKQKKVKKVLSGNAWLSRPPTYRSAAAALDFETLHNVLEAEKKRQRANTTKGAQYHKCDVGDPTEKELPIVAKNVNRIRKEFIDSEWIDALQEDDASRFRVYCTEEENSLDDMEQQDEWDNFNRVSHQDQAHAAGRTTSEERSVSPEELEPMQSGSEHENEDGNFEEGAVIDYGLGHNLDLPYESLSEDLYNLEDLMRSMDPHVM